MSNNGQRHRGVPFVLSAPAGTGKTTLVSKLKEEFSSVVQSISCTSRKPRPSEQNGIDYFFLSDEEFEKKIEKGDFLEYVKLYDYYYGTDKQWVKNELDQGHHVFLVIDTQGAMKLKENYPAVFIFVEPPSINELRRRIESRMEDTTEMIEKRLNWAKNELALKRKYDYLITNDDFDAAYQALKSIVIAEEHRIKQNIL